MQRLAGKTAVITGAGSGIGKAAAQTFVREGANVLIVDVDAERAKRVCNEIGDKQADWIAADVADETATKNFVSHALERFGGIDIGILNAGVAAAMGPLLQSTVENFDRTYAINTRGPMLGIKHMAPEMIRRGGGCFVLTSSGAGIRGIRNMGDYVAAKHGTIGLMRTAALELIEYNIRVNCVLPGGIDSGAYAAVEKIYSKELADKAVQNMIDLCPMKRMGKPQEVANLMLFLASDEASFCHAGSYMADGGIMEEFQTF